MHEPSTLASVITSQPHTLARREDAYAASTIQQCSKIASVDGRWERRISLCKCVCIIIDKCQCAFVLSCFYRVAVVHACLVLCIFRAQLPPGLFDRLYVCDDLELIPTETSGVTFCQLPNTEDMLQRAFALEIASYPVGDLHA